MKILDNVRKTVVITLTLIATLYLILYVLSLDSQTVDQMMIGGMIACICGMWDAAFAYANIDELKK